MCGKLRMKCRRKSELKSLDSTNKKRQKSKTRLLPFANNLNDILLLFLKIPLL
jgi:hypothetical protein